MAFRNIRLGFLNVLRASSVSNIVTENAVDSAFPVDYLVDDSASRTTRFAASLANHTVEIDRGSDWASLPDPDRVFIPAGHNLSSTYKIEMDTTANFGTPTEIGSGSFPATVGDAFQKEFTTCTQRYLRLLMVGTGLWHIPELVWSETRTFTRGANLDGARDTLLHQNLFIQRVDGGVTVVELGVDKRRFEATWHNMVDADLDILTELIAEVGTSRPFLIDPISFSATPDTDEPVRWVRLVEDVPKIWGVSATGLGIKRQTVSLIFEDHIG